MTPRRHRWAALTCVAALLVGCSSSGEDEADPTASTAVEAGQDQPDTTGDEGERSDPNDPATPDENGRGGPAATDDEPGPDDGHGPDPDLDEPFDGDISEVTAAWSHTAAQLRDGDEAFTRVTCPPDGSDHRVWGTDIYSDDSAVCPAAVHIGILDRSRGGEFLIEHRPGLDSYQGSTRNGVTTRDWDSWPASFVFIGARGVAIEGGD